jgi:hypothetical protein
MIKMIKVINYLSILPWERLRLRQANQWALLQMLCYLYRSISGAVWIPSFDFFLEQARAVLFNLQIHSRRDG